LDNPPSVAGSFNGLFPFSVTSPVEEKRICFTHKTTKRKLNHVL